MTFNPYSELGTGGLKDFDETERVAAEIRPLVDELIKKAEEINVPIHLTICNSMYLDSTGVGSSLIHICNGREENGNMKLPVTFKALSAIAQDVDLAMETVLKYLGQHDPTSAILKNAFSEALSSTDDAREIRGCDPLDCENCDKKDECPIRPMVESTKGLFDDLKRSLSAFNNIGHKPVKDSESALIDKIIDDGFEPEEG